jgi:hypothetical protein
VVTEDTEFWFGKEIKVPKATTTKKQNTQCAASRQRPPLQRLRPMCEWSSPALQRQRADWHKCACIFGAFAVAMIDAVLACHENQTNIWSEQELPQIRFLFTMRPGHHAGRVALNE